MESTKISLSSPQTEVVAGPNILKLLKSSLTWQTFAFMICISVVHVIGVVVGFGKPAFVTMDKLDVISVPHVTLTGGATVVVVDVVVAVVVEAVVVAVVVEAVVVAVVGVDGVADVAVVDGADVVPLVVGVAVVAAALGTECFRKMQLYYNGFSAI